MCEGHMARGTAIREDQWFVSIQKKILNIGHCNEQHLSPAARRFATTPGATCRHPVTLPGYGPSVAPPVWTCRLTAPSEP